MGFPTYVGVRLMRGRALTAVGLVVGALALGTWGTAQALEFVADRAVRSDGQTRKASVFFRDDRWRVEHNDAGPVNVTIVRKDMGLVWLLFSRSRQFKTVAYDQEHDLLISERLEREVARVEIGTDSLDGHPTTVYEVTAASPEGKRSVYYQWMATDLGFPLRLVSKDRDWMTEYRNVRLTEISDAFFRLPLAYQPVTDSEADTSLEVPRPTPMSLDVGRPPALRQ